MSAPGNRARWYGVVRFRSIFGVLLGTVILPTVALTVVGILTLVFWRADFDVAFGIITLSFSVAVIVGAILATVLVQRSARRAGEQSDFVWSVSHELKTPLTSIRMFAETLLHGLVTSEEERRECLEHIAREADRLSILVERLLDVRKMEAGERIFADETLSVPDVVERAVDSLVPLMKERTISVGVSVSGPIPPLRGDREALVSAVTNLLENAIRYGGGRGSSVAVRVRAQNRVVSVEVEDFGPGIPRLALQRIFDKFYRVNPALSRQEGGLGIGLALVRQIVEAHGGTVTVQSQVGKGTVFTVRMPVPKSLPDGRRRPLGDAPGAGEAQEPGGGAAPAPGDEKALAPLEEDEHV